MNRLLEISKRILGGFKRHGDMIVSLETITEFQDAIVEADAIENAAKGLPLRATTRTDLMSYLNTLDKDAREIFTLAELIDIEKGDCDTLCEEFQIAAAVQEVFWNRARAMNACTCGEDLSSGLSLPHKSFCPKYGK